MEELLQLGIIDASRAEAENHLCRQRVGVTPDVIHEQFRSLQ